MKREYERPSMAMNLFDTTDVTNIDVLSAAAFKAGSKAADTYGYSKLNGLKLNN